jgi:streptogramin lyase
MRFGGGSPGRLLGAVAVAAALATAGLLVSPSASAATGDITTYEASNLLFVENPYDIAAGPDGNLWFTNSNNRIGRIDPDDGSITSFVPPPSTIALPFGITAGPDGNLWFTSRSNQRIGRIDPDDGSFTAFSDPASGISSPYDIAAGSDGNLWFTSRGNDRIGRIDPDDGSIATFTDPAGNVSAPESIAAGPDGNLWFTCQGSERIGRIDPDDGSITTFALPAGPPWYPLGITAGPDGGLWFTGNINDRIGRIDPDDGSILVYADPDDEVSNPHGIALGRDGNLWFTSNGNDRIGWIDPDDGTITTYADPEAEIANNYGITSGPDGNLWFTSYGPDRIGRIEPAPIAPGVPTSVTASGTDEGAEVSWSAPSSDGGSEVTSYVVYRDGVEVHETADGSTLSFTDSGLSNGTTYEYEVAAVNAAGEGAKSSPVAEATPRTVPGAPTSVTASGTDEGAEVSWSAPSSDGGSEVTSYVVYRDGVEVHETADGSTLSFTDSGLSNGTTYEYEVAAVNAAGEGAKSSPVAEATPQAPVVTPTFTDVGLTHEFFADIEWMAAEGISEGYEPGPTYRPLEPVTRQAMSAFLYRLAGSPSFTPPTTRSFSDVSPAHPFFAEIEWMADTGIAAGYSNGTYAPGAPVTRQAMSAFLYRVAGEPTFTAPTVASFTDVGIGHPFFAEVEWMAAEGLSEGTEPGPRYLPMDAVSRQAMSAFMHRLADGPGVDV